MDTPDKSSKLDELAPLRQRIDAIDARVLACLNERAEIVLEVGRIKNNKGAPLHVPEREAAILERLTRDNPGPFPNPAVTRVFREIISASLNLEGPIRVAYLGPEATHTHLAAKHYFGGSCSFLPHTAIPDVMAAVVDGEVEYGVVPVENSTEGGVSVTLDEIANSAVKVVGETELRIRHCLMARDSDIETIRRVVAHPQALAQCRQWLASHLPNPVVEASATAAVAAREAARTQGTAAIAHREAATEYGLQVIRENIEDNAANRTRFWVVSREYREPSGNDKTSLLVSVQDAPGSLHALLGSFHTHGINLSRIESRPAKQRPWEYLFFIDLLGHVKDAPVQAALTDADPHSAWIRVLGSYPVATAEDS